MNLPSFSVRRPIFTTMVTLIIVTLGLASLVQLRIDMLPEVEMPRLTVRTDYEGADPEVVERLVTQPVEEILATVPGVEEMTSESSEGRSDVRVTFSWGIDIDVAAQDVRSRLEDELDELPDEIGRPQIRKFDVASFPVVILGVASELDPVELTELIEKQIRYRFSRIPGVAQVDPWGGYNRELRVELDPAKLRALGLPLTSILEAIRSANLDLPAGQIDDGRHEIRIRAPAEFRTPEDVAKTVVTVRDGAPITLGEIARVRDTYERLTRIVRVNGELGLRLAIRKQADANTVEVSERVLAEIEAIRADYPQIEIVAVSNQGNFIERSISNVATSVLYGGGLAILVLLFFLRSVRSTLVISLAIPISLVATFALIYFGGLTLNLMTLGGLALGVGMMVDSSIVVIENIFRRRDEEGEDGSESSVRGASEVATAILASTITTVIIFLPLMFAEGISGLLFRELAYVVAFSLACSLVVALTLVPMLASRLAGGARLVHPEGSLAARAEAAMHHLAEGYRDLLSRALKRRALTVVVAVAITAVSVFLFPLIGSEFLPPSDEGEVRVTGEMEIGARLDLVDKQTHILERMVGEKVPEATATVVTVGSSGYRADGASEGEIQMSLRPAAERSRSNAEIANQLRRELSGKVPGMEIRTRAPQGQFVLERLLGSSEEGLTVEIRGFDLEILDHLAKRAETILQGVDGITDTRRSRRVGVPQAMVRIDRDKAAQLGLTPRDVAETLETAVAGRRVGDYRPSGDSYRILVQLENAQQLSMDEILDMSIEVPGSGETVALRNVVAVDDSRGPVLIDRKDQQRIVSITANFAGRDLGSVARDAEAALAAIAKPMGYDIDVAGNFEEQQEAQGQLLLSLALALALVYMVLACQYESLRDPLVVMLSVPVAATGVLLTLWLTHTTLNVQSYIGCIMLGGIVVNNAILLVDQAGQLRLAGMRSHDAVVEAGRRRLRPILMTTATTILGLLPLALGIGEGAEAQAALARAVIGGLTGSTLITLVLIPVVYTLFHPEGDAHKF